MIFSRQQPKEDGGHGIAKPVEELIEAADVPVANPRISSRVNPTHVVATESHNGPVIDEGRKGLRNFILKADDDRIPDGGDKVRPGRKA